MTKLLPVISGVIFLALICGTDLIDWTHKAVNAASPLALPMVLAGSALVAACASLLVLRLLRRPPA